MRKILMAYVPVLHRGYLKFFLKHHQGSDALYVFGSEVLEEFDHLRKDIRSLPPDWAITAIRNWNLFPKVILADQKELQKPEQFPSEIIMPDEDECHAIAEKYLSGHEITFDNIFLRWDRTKSLAEKQVEADRIVSVDKFDREMMGLAVAEAAKSPDWWRQIGGVIVSPEKEVLLVTHNHPVRTPREHLFSGDPRSNFKRGISIELSLFSHAEPALVGEAARRGLKLEGCSLYVTVFPCPPCAKLVSKTGIKRLYFSEGYSMVDGEEDLRKAGVEIIRVR